jgi:hypothetical protein
MQERCILYTCGVFRVPPLIVTHFGGQASYDAKTCAHSCFNSTYSDLCILIFSSLAFYGYT